MKPAVLAWLVFASLLTASDKPRKQPARSLEVEVLELNVARADDKLNVEGRVRNSGERPIRKLVLVFHFLAPGRETIARGRGPAEEEILEPGQEHEFQYHLVDHARAVWVVLSAEDGSGGEPRVVKPGPYPIE